MLGLSIHVVDVARGQVAAGMQIAVNRRSNDGGIARIASGQIAANGLPEEAALARRLAPGQYEAQFHVGAECCAIGARLPATPLLDTVIYRFGIDEPERHYHLPFKCTPWATAVFAAACRRRACALVQRGTHGRRR